MVSLPRLEENIAKHNTRPQVTAMVGANQLDLVTAVGEGDGAGEGEGVGESVGAGVGLSVGLGVGWRVGLTVGAGEGARVGVVGWPVGNRVG